ncbi:MAG: hypothetical protein ACYTBV_13005 [Planctomycetota bacterium]|jgi:hypothetical protein
MGYKTENYIFDFKGNITGYDEVRTWKIELVNTRKLPVDLEITRGFDTPYWSLSTDQIVEMGENRTEYKKHDATHARFKTKMQPQSKRSFTYTVTTYHGRREEQANQ